VIFGIKLRLKLTKE